MKTLARAEDEREMRGRLAALDATAMRRWGVMTASEMLCHLREAFRMAAGDSAVSAMPGPLPGRVMKVLALRVPKVWPKNVPTVPELRVGSERMRSTSFAEDKQGMMAAFEGFLRLNPNRSDHPMFGAMRPADWMRWGYLHTDHHLRQFGR